MDLFQVAVMAKYSISITELIRQVTEQNPRVRSLTGDIDEALQIRKLLVYCIYLLEVQQENNFGTNFRILHFVT